MNNVISLEEKKQALKTKQQAIAVDKKEMEQGIDYYPEDKKAYKDVNITLSIPLIKALKKRAAKNKRRLKNEIGWRLASSVEEELI
jgi:hypothetical protein